MKQQLILIMTIGVFITHAHAMSIIYVPFTNRNETVYVDNGKKLLRVDARHEGEFVVADGTETIGEWSFSRCTNLTSVVMPDSVTNIMRDAFDNCSSLTNVVFGSGLREIGGGGVVYCKSLERVALPDSLETVSRFAFAGCPRLEEVTIGAGLRTVGRNGFSSSVTSFVVSPSNRWLRVENGKLVPIPQDETRE